MKEMKKKIRKNVCIIHNIVCFAYSEFSKRDNILSKIFYNIYYNTFIKWFVEK